MSKDKQRREARKPKKTKKAAVAPSTTIVPPAKPAK
jgi:hypothetical protein